jgi:hypothetical protein
MQIEDLFVDVVLAVNVKGNCNSKFYLRQKYSTNWFTTYAVNNKYLIKNIILYYII